MYPISRSQSLEQYSSTQPGQSRGIKFGQYLTLAHGTTLRAVNDLLARVEEDGDADEFHFMPLTRGHMLILPDESLLKIRQSTTAAKGLEYVLNSPDLQDERVVVTGVYKDVGRGYDRLLNHTVSQDAFISSIRDKTCVKELMSEESVKGLIEDAAMLEHSGDSEGLPANELLLADKRRPIGIAVDKEKELIRKFYADNDEKRNDFRTHQSLHNAFINVLSSAM